MFVKKWPFEYQKVNKTHLHTYLRDSSDSSESSDPTTLYTKKHKPTWNLPTYLCDSSYCRVRSEWKNHATSTHKNHATSPHTKSCNLSTKKNIMQPLHKKNNAICPQKSHATSPHKNYAISPQKKNYETPRKKNHATWVREWVRKITQPLHTQKSPTSPHTKTCNLSTKISRNLSTKKIMQPLHKTSQELQNAALRTSHRLSNVLNCTFQKYWESKKKL